MVKRILSLLLCIVFIASNANLSFSSTFSVAELPKPGTMVMPSASYVPLSLKGMIINPQKPLEFQFVVDTGNSKSDLNSVKEDANVLIRYFLTGITIPEKDLWVNLSPYEKDRTIPEALGQTEMGRDLLAQDYILKQLSASLIYPEKDLGKAFWSRVYKLAQEKFGTKDIPVSTFNKVWILPDVAQVYEQGNEVYVTKATFKVMLDEDYTAKGKNDNTKAASISSAVIREILLPEITKEVNSGKNFAPLRQIYQALILAKWYKETVQNSLFEAVYTNKSKIQGVNLSDLTLKEKIYERYTQAYKKGVFNYIKESSKERTPRKYFSGGTRIADYMIDHSGQRSVPVGKDVLVDAAVLSDKGVDKAMNLRAFFGLGGSASNEQTRKVSLPLRPDFSNDGDNEVINVGHMIVKEAWTLDNLLDFVLEKDEQNIGLFGLYLAALATHGNDRLRVLFLNKINNDRAYKKVVPTLFDILFNAQSYRHAYMAKIIINESLGKDWNSIDEARKRQSDRVRLGSDEGRAFNDRIINFLENSKLEKDINGQKLERLMGLWITVYLLRPSAAMLGQAENNVIDGGVDLNQIKLNHSGKKMQVRFDKAQLSAMMQGDFQGFKSIVTNLRYIQAPFSAVGVNR